MAIFPGGSLNDMLMGTAMDDVLWGGPGDDELSGGAGNDRLAGGPGADNLNGGSDMDTADYTGSMDPVHVDLRSPFGRDDDDPVPVHGGDAEGDILTSIEHIWGSQGADTLIGNHVGNLLAGNSGDDNIYGFGGSDQLYGEAGNDVLDGSRGSDVLSGGMGIDELIGGTENDTLRGGDGDDALYGQEGNDVLEGGGGADILDGGDDGSDTAAYTMSDEGVTINLAHAQDASPLTPGPSGGDAQGDTLMGIENLRGSMDDDKLTGDPEANKLYGNQGDDELMGGAGNDVLRGGKGDDEIEGGAGNDTIRGDKGDDELDGGAGNDTFHLMEGDGDDTIEDFDSGKDTIRFGPATEKLTASDIRDILDTEDENRDGTFTYEWEDVSVTVDQPLKDTDFGVRASSTSLDNNPNNWPDADVSAKELRGDNVIHGLDGDDTIRGGDGDDSLFGNGGNDHLMGEDDDDTLNGGRGNDNLKGGDDMDVLMGGSGNDTLSGDRHNDELTGGSGSDTFWFGPRDGHDTIKDFAPGDIISLGNAPLSMAEIDKVLATVRENDDGYYTYDWERTSFTVNRALTEDDFQKADPTMLPAGQKDWPGTGESNTSSDKVYGNDLANMLDGGAGNDMLSGGKGDDTLDGGMGDDTLTGGTGNDTFQIDAKAGSDTIKDFLAGDMIMLGDKLPTAAEVQAVLATRVQGDDGGYVYKWMDTSFAVDRVLMSDDFEQQAVVAPDPDPTILAPDRTEAWPDKDKGETNSDDDKVQGNAAANSIKGGEGDDNLKGGAGNDKLDGEEDDDNLMGEAGDDNLMGGAGNDILDGGAGYDTLSGGTGDDMVYADADDVSTVAADITTRTPSIMGGTGTDTLSFVRSTKAIDNGAARASGGTAVAHPVDDGFEKVIGSNYGDMLTVSGTRAMKAISLMGGGGNDTLDGGAGNDMLDGDAGNDMLNGGAGNDMLDGGAGNDMLNGGAGNDMLDGGAGSDMLDGGAGNDMLDGGAGNDMLDGGAGNDITHRRYRVGHVHVGGRRHDHGLQSGDG